MRFGNDIGEAAQERQKAVRNFLSKETLVASSERREFFPVPASIGKGHSSKTKEVKKYLVEQLMSLDVGGSYVISVDTMEARQIKSLRQRLNSLRVVVRKESGRDFLVAKFQDEKLGACLGVWRRV